MDLPSAPVSKAALSEGRHLSILANPSNSLILLYRHLIQLWLPRKVEEHQLSSKLHFHSRMVIHSATDCLGSSSLLTVVISQENTWDSLLQPFPGELGWKKENCHMPGSPHQPPAGRGCHSPAQIEELHLADEGKFLGCIILSQKIPYILITSSANEVCD